MEKPDVETVYAVPEQWIILYRGTRAMAHYVTYPNQAAAEQYLARCMGLSDAYAVVRATWQQRDKIEAVNNRHPHCVWQDQRWWVNNRSIWEPTGVRPSAKNHAMLAYYQTPAKACQGVLTQIRPGRFLTRFFKGILSEAEIACMARWQETGSLDNPYTSYELGFATTREEIADVYMSGPDSCMSGSDWDVGMHPCEVYAAGDLAVAYLRGTDADTPRPPYIARTLCWPDRKIFGRVYPTPHNYVTDGFSSSEDATAAQQALRNKLLALGYAETGHRSSGFAGARLLRIGCTHPDEDEPAWVMPYIDGAYYAKDRRDHFVLSESDGYRAESTDGAIRSQLARCYCCEEFVNRDDMFWVQDGYTERHVCAGCVDSDTFVCEGNGVRYFRNEEQPIEIDEAEYSLNYVERYFVRSDRSGEWCRCPVTVRLANGDLERWSFAEAEEHAVLVGGLWTEQSALDLAMAEMEQGEPS